MLLISDLDGTAIDSEELIIASYRHVITTHRLAPRSQTELKKCVGIALRELYSSWTSPAEYEKLCETHRTFQTLNEHMVKAIPGIPEAFRTLRQRGVRIAINTNRSGSTKEFLSLTGLAPLVDHVVARNDVIDPKPHPEGILKIINHFDSTPEEVWMFGDTPIDIEAGKRAGIRTIGALFDKKVPDDHFKEWQPDYLIRSPEELLGIII